MRRRCRGRFTRAAFDDRGGAAKRSPRKVDVATYEFENLPVEPLAVLGDKLRPGLKSLAIAQDRATRRAFIESHRRPGRAVAVGRRAWRM